MSLIPGQSDSQVRDHSQGRNPRGILKWADEGQSSSSRGRTARPKQTATSNQNKGQSAGNVVPFYSWFSGITQFQKGKEFNFQKGQGVPVATGIPLAEQKGYWYRHQRKAFKTADGNLKPLQPRWYFYYLGTGPHHNINYGTHIDGVVWVASPGVDTSSPSRVMDRDPGEHDAQVTRFAPGTIIPQGFYIEGSSRPGSRSASRSRPNSSSRSSSRAASRASSPGGQGRVATPDMADQIAKLVLEKLGKNGGGVTQVTKQSAKEVRAKMLNKPRQKRTPSAACTVTQCFGKRGPSQNFGNEHLVKVGTSDSKFPILAELAPTPGAFFFGSKLKLEKLQSNNDKEHYELQYHGAIKFDSSMPGFQTIMQMLNENLDAYQKEQSAHNGEHEQSPKPQRKQRQRHASVAVKQEDVDALLANTQHVVQKEDVKPKQPKSMELTPDDFSLLAKLDEPYEEPSLERPQIERL
nr:nucleocapsid protein [Grimso virus]